MSKVLLSLKSSLKASVVFEYGKEMGVSASWRRKLPQNKTKNADSRICMSSKE
jgi:hypothetical protein